MSYTYFRPRQKINVKQSMCKSEDVSSDGYKVSLENLFYKLREIYAEKETTSLSGKTQSLSEEEQYRSYGGLIISAKGERLDLLFSYYVMGDEDDEAVVLDSYNKNNQFLCFNCDICSIDKTESVALYDNSSVKIIQNVVDKLCRDIETKSGVKFRMTPNATIYLPGHLLVSTCEHIPNYSTFMRPKILMGYFSILSSFYDMGINVNCLWNGRTGSDVYHSHCHLTDYKIPVIEYIRQNYGSYKNLINPIKARFEKDLSERQYILLRSSDGTELHSAAFIFIMNTQVYQTDKFKSLKELAVVANFFVHEHEGRIEYCIIFSLVNRLGRFFSVEGRDGTSESFFCIPSTSQIIINEDQIEFVKDNQDKMINKVNKYLFYPVDKIDDKDFEVISYGGENLSQIDFAKKIVVLVNALKSPFFSVDKIDPRLLRVEAFEYLHSVNIKMGEYKNSFIEILRSYDCFRSLKKCPPESFALFKLVLTYVFLYSARVEDNEIIVDLEMRGFLNEISLMAGIFNYKEFNKPLDVSECMWIRGNYVGELLTKTIGNTIMYTPIEEINNLLIAENKKIGDDSAFGYNVKANINFIKNFDLLVKIQNLDETSSVEDFAHEVEAGKCINKIRKNCYNFMLTFGRMICKGSLPTPPKKKSKKAPVYELCETGAGFIHSLKDKSNMGYIFVEYISPSTTFSSALEDGILSTTSIYSLICQTLGTLLYANLKYGFTHYDFHLGNILIVEINTCIDGTYMISNYDVLDRTLSIVCDSYYPVIIDYGRSYLNCMNKDKISVDDEMKNTYGLTSDRSDKIFDHWTFFIQLLIDLIAYKPEVILQTNINSILEQKCSNHILEYILIMLRHTYYLIQSPVVSNVSYYNSDAYSIYESIFNLCIDVSQGEWKSSSSRYSYVKKEIMERIFKNVTDKFDNEGYIWLMPEKFRKNIKADILLNDIENLIASSQMDIREDLESEMKQKIQTINEIK